MKPFGDAVSAVARALGIDEGEIAHRKAFLEFGEADVRLLTELRARLQGAQRRFVDEFYAHLLKFDETRRFIPDAESLERLKRTQATYFETLTAGDYGPKYILDRLRVGIVHQRIGLEPKWYIGAYSKYLSGLLPELWRLLGDDPDRFLAACRALQKIVLLDMGLAIDTYIQADRRAILGLKKYAEDIIASLPAGLLVVDDALKVLRVNRSFRELFGWKNGEDLVGRELEDILPVPDLREQARGVLASGVALHGVDAMLNGKHFLITLTGIRLAEEEEEEERRLLVIVEDVSARKHAEERLSHLAYYDTLTDLPNRVLLLERLQQALVDAERVERIVAVMFLDLDRFKVINDTLGHHVGDALLKAVAERLKSCLRPGDIIARLGGDEFTVVLANVAHVDDVARVARKILEGFAAPFRVENHELFTTTSIGITLFPLDVQEPEKLLKNADAAMYHAKESGRNAFQFFTAELNVRAERRLRLETALRQALGENQLSLHYQPQVDLKSGRIVGMEALARWNHPELGAVSPAEFIPIAEETGLILPIGEWALREACRQIKAWHATGFPKLQVAVNVSGKQLRQKNFADRVREILLETKLEPRYLDLEITESLLMKDAEETGDILHVLHDMGVSFSVDDFGTGYSSLSYLKRFPIDILKIDQSFVRDLATDPNDVAIVKTIIAMAHTLGMRVIAEGVETYEQLSFLRDQGCDGTQGYYCSKPLPADDFTELLADWKRLSLGKCRLEKPRRRPGRARHPPSGAPQRG